MIPEITAPLAGLISVGRDGEVASRYQVSVALRDCNHVASVTYIVLSPSIHEAGALKVTIVHQVNIHESRIPVAISPVIV